MRELMAIHRSKPSCNACHGLMDPLGFALENFDAVGQCRTRIASPASPSTPRGELPDGTQLKGPDDLRNALLRKPDQFVQTLTEKLMTYALGPHARLQGHADGARDRARRAADDYRFRIAGDGHRHQRRFQIARSRCRAAEDREPRAGVRAARSAE